MSLPDPEKHARSPTISSLSPSPSRPSADIEKPSLSPSPTTDIPPTHSSTTGPLARLRHFEAVLDRKFGVESHGPARIPPNARQNPPKAWVMAALWASGTMNLSCFATGFLGWEFGLSLTQSILVIVFGTLLGAMVTGWCATMGGLLFLYYIGGESKE